MRKSREREQPNVITKLPRELRFGDRLRRLAADAGDADGPTASGLVARGDGFGGEREHRLEQSVSRIANGELRGVNTDRDPARAGGVVVTGQRALVLLVELALRRQGERMCGDHQPFVESSANFRRDLREVRHGYVGCGWILPRRSAGVTSVERRRDVLPLDCMIRSVSRGGINTRRRALRSAWTCSTVRRRFESSAPSIQSLGRVVSVVGPAGHKV